MGIANATGGFTERLLPANRDRVSYALLMHPTKEFAVTQVIETVRNGVDTEQMYGTLDAIKAKPELGVFQFRASNRWLGGAHNRSTIKDLYGAGQEDDSRAVSFVVDAGEPAVLLGVDTGPNPAEALLHALAACLTTTLVYIAAARKVNLTEVESVLEGNMDVRGCLGVSDDVRNGGSARTTGTCDTSNSRIVAMTSRTFSSRWTWTSAGRSGPSPSARSARKCSYTRSLRRP